MVSPINDKDIEPIVKKHNSKLVQVVQNFFNKIVAIIIDSRGEEYKETPQTLRINKWFNLLMPSLAVKDDLKLWKNTSDITAMPPMIIETSIDVQELSYKTALVLKDDDNNPWTVIKHGGSDNKKREVVVERWLIEFDHNEVSGSLLDEIPLIYKQAIIAFRSIYMITRIMPAFKLKQFINKSTDLPIRLTNTVVDGHKPVSSKGRIGLSKSIIPHQMMASSHLEQRRFHPITTSFGTLKISVMYRRHYRFCIYDSEQLLSSHFLLENSLDKPRDQDLNNDHSPSLSPNTSVIVKEDETKKPKQAIQPFKVGSMGNSPPPVSSSLERRISITSNRSASNASLVAMLRNQRGSVSSVTGTGSPNIPIQGPANPNLAFSISSHDIDDAGTPRFSSSFGSRASRRFSNASVRQNVLHANYDPSVSGTSSGLQTSMNPISGVYIDDDISDFVRMIDSKTDLRLSGLGGTGGIQMEGDRNVLSKFQLLRLQHQQLTDSVIQSLILHQSPPPGLGPAPGAGAGHGSSRHGSSLAPSSTHSHGAITGTSAKSTSASPAPSPAPSHFSTEPVPSINSRLDTKPQNRKSIEYTTVFDDDDDGEDYYLQSKDKKKDEDDDDLLFTMSDMNLTKH